MLVRHRIFSIREHSHFKHLGVELRIFMNFSG